MRTINNLLQGTKKIDLETELLLSLEDTSKDYVSLQRAQMLEGVRSDGENIFNVKTGSDEYSPSYARKKGKKKPIDLKDRGDFHRDLFVDVRQEEMVIDSADSKSEMLQENYGAEILGLADERKRNYAERSAVRLKERLTDQLNVR